MRPVDADSLREVLIKLQYEVSPENMNEACVMAVDNAPPLPAVPPKHYGDIGWVCGSCGYPGMYIGYAYCPNCGREVKWNAEA